jgi:regulator of RNase E activity RraA
MPLKAETIERIKKELFTAVVGDVLFSLGYRRQFLPPRITPLHPETVLVGRAMPVLEADSFDSTKAFGMMFEALDDLKPGEIYLVTGGSPCYALWGELMSTAARHRGAAGAILDGYVRDTKGIIALNFPVFAAGSYAQDQRGRGRVIDYRCPVEIEGVQINPGDLLFGDVDGVVVIPAVVEAEVVEKSLEKVHTENELRKAIEAGMLATEAFAKYVVF